MGKLVGGELLNVEIRNLPITDRGGLNTASNRQ